MKRLEKFLRLNDWLCWLFRIGLFLLWLAWGLQLYGPLRVEFRKEMAYQRSRSIAKERQAMQTICRFITTRAERSRQLGSKYRPKEYFQDYGDILEKQEKLRIGNFGSFSAGANELHARMIANFRAGRFRESEISYYAERFKYFRLEGGSHRDEMRNAVKQAGLERVSIWVLFIYTRTILLFLPIFLMRMIDDRGILETILADKRKFVLALVAWPYYFSKYPTNVVRGIIVEAELRRIGQLFRRFSPDEKERVRVIANSSEYREWLLRYRAKNAGWFQRSLAFALLATIACMVFLPAKAKASTGGPSSKIVVVETIRAGPNVVSDQQEDAGSGFPADLPRPLEIAPGSIEILLSDDALPSSRQGGDKIDHIPLSNCVTWASASKSCRTRRGHEIHRGVCGTDSDSAVLRLHKCFGYQ